ncbi:MAG: VanW family protein, partial [Selenomonadaceae bacterium]|nr:VanW family protein [Selenomonadaceae bacterium]
NFMKGEFLLMQILNLENLNLKALISTKGVPIATAAAVLVGATSLAVSNSVAEGDKIVSGVQSDGHDIGGLTHQQAKNFFEKSAEQKLQPLIFAYNGQEFQIQPQDIALTAQVDKALEEAERYGRGKGLLANLGEQISCLGGGRDVKLAAVYDEDLLNQKIDEIAAQVNTQPVNARCNLHSNGMIEPIAGVIGKKLDRDKLAASLKDPLTNLTIPKQAINLELDDVEPFIKTEDIENIDTILGQYSTYYYPGDRGDNIWIAANAISDKILKTGWEFSFNTTVGPRTWEAGYKPAGVIINGKPDIDYGGGVCQVSSTLYNAVLLAGLTPTERTPHYFQSSYIGYGRDATVADGQIDFKFRNDLPHTVYLIGEASGSTLTVYVLGTRADLNGATIAVENDGASLYRTYYKDGQVIKDEYLHTDQYYTQSAT